MHGTRVLNSIVLYNNSYHLYNLILSQISLSTTGSFSIIFSEIFLSQAWKLLYVPANHLTFAFSTPLLWESQSEKILTSYLPHRCSSRPECWVPLRTCVTSACPRSLPCSRPTSEVTWCASPTRNCRTRGEKTVLSSLTFKLRLFFLPMFVPCSYLFVSARAG